MNGLKIFFLYIDPTFPLLRTHKSNVRHLVHIRYSFYFGGVRKLSTCPTLIPYTLSSYSFGKTNSQKCKLNFMILQTNLAIGSSNFIGIIRQAHYEDNRFNLNFQPISMYVSNFIIWYPYSQRHKIEFMNCITISHKEHYIM